MGNHKVSTWSVGSQEPRNEGEDLLGYVEQAYIWAHLVVQGVYDGLKLVHMQTFVNLFNCGKTGTNCRNRCHDGVNNVLYPSYVNLHSPVDIYQKGLHAVAFKRGRGPLERPSALTDWSSSSNVRAARMSLP